MSYHVYFSVLNLINSAGFHCNLAKIKILHHAMLCIKCVRLAVFIYKPFSA